MMVKYRVVWLLCLENDLRLVEAVDLINGFSESRLTEINKRCAEYLATLKTKANLTART